MSVMVKRNIEHHLSSLGKTLGDLVEDRSEITALQTRLKTEKDELVKNLIAERLKRLEASTQKPHPMLSFKKELTKIHTLLTEANTMMAAVPTYVTTNRGRKVTKRKGK